MGSSEGLADIIEPRELEKRDCSVLESNGSKRECKNYREITLLSAPRKVFACIVLWPLKGLLLKLKRSKKRYYSSQINQRFPNF